MSRVKTGLDMLLADPGRHLPGKRLGLVANQTSVTADLIHASQALSRLKGIQLVTLFAPEHGYYGVEQDMAEVAAATDPATGLPIHSLYGQDAHSLLPDPALFQNLDALVFDIQDVGARYYTFIYTLANCLLSAGRAGVPVVVLDRPNPINGAALEGNRVQDGFFSFVGQYPLLIRHGMTIGELARMFRDAFNIDCELTVVPMDNWDRRMWFDETGLPWVPPSPNMPTLDTAMVYPGLCLVEGTQLSEGRGTTRPFEQVGAPGIDPLRLADVLNNEEPLPGVVFRPQTFKPTFQKHAHQVCGGVFLHVTDRDAFRPGLTGIALLKGIAREFPDVFAWRTEPYEFVSDRPAIDLLYGSDRFRQTGILPETALFSIVESWEPDRVDFQKMREHYLLY